METLEKPVQKNGKRRWSTEQKVAILQEWQGGIPVEELCRRYSLNAGQIYKWKSALDRGLKDQGQLVPKSQVSTLQKKVDDLERALGRKALEVDVLKKVFEHKGMKPPEGT